MLVEACGWRSRCSRGSSGGGVVSTGGCGAREEDALRRCDGQIEPVSLSAAMLLCRSRRQRSSSRVDRDDRIVLSGKRSALPATESGRRTTSTAAPLRRGGLEATTAVARPALRARLHADQRHQLVPTRPLHRSKCRGHPAPARTRFRILRLEKNGRRSLAGARRSSADVVIQIARAAPLWCW